jgi:hypothetical protein
MAMATEEQKREARRRAAECFLEGAETIEQLRKSGPIATWLRLESDACVSAPLKRIAAAILAAEERGRTEERAAVVAYGKRVEAERYGTERCAGRRDLREEIDAGEHVKESDHG